MHDNSTLFTKMGEREVEMHELRPYITRTRIRSFKILTSKNPRIFGLNLDSQRGTLRLTITLTFRMMIQSNSTTSWVIFLNGSSYGRLYVGLVRFDKSRV